MKSFEMATSHKILGNPSVLRVLTPLVVPLCCLLCIYLHVCSLCVCRTEICCGIIFKGANGECLVDTNLLRPCRTCKPSSHMRGSASPTPLSHEASPVPEDLSTPDVVDGSSQDSSSSLAAFTASSECLQQAAEAVLDLSLPKQPSTLVHPPPCIQMEA